MAAIRQFYKDSTILISGATGFLGQILLEKTLRTLKPRKVYLLIRKKKGLDAQPRLEKLMQGVVFDRVRSLSTVPKVEAIEVDMTQEDLALNPQTRHQLEQEVNVVFQLAASVSFNEPLEVSLRENVRNNLHLYDLVKQMKNLQSAMQVSTMYSNCDNSVIREKVYTDVGFGGYDSIVNLMSKLSEPEKQALTPFIVKNLPNTYTFAKKCVEVKIQQEFSNLPVGIFRPPGSSRHFMNIRTKNEVHYRIAVQLMRAHASALDRIRIWTGQRPGIQKAIERALQMMEKSRAIAITTWEAENANVRRIQQNLDLEEQKLFPCDLKNVDWRQHYADFIPGIKKHVLRMA